MVSSYSKYESAMKPAKHAVCQVLDECGYIHPEDDGFENPGTKSRILFHMISNGGINLATNLLIVLERKLGKPLPLVDLICDSIPTGASYIEKCWDFLSISLPR
ncbi:uncharacterized protein F4817DRAFT_349023 [Daldinia loculata]|uniref:uncharacterized protein n=1 Tax=Daldinia loculata TaxID=103429 RepID=UPI0020C531C3|nr:uncharacterized protein F4817DRAFT_349023 [Daldinia loculata]KAI1643683.1 hypothetical protein F4817DRAFT_349023 [Daldinia loculata]